MINVFTPEQILECCIKDHVEVLKEVSPTLYNRESSDDFNFYDTCLIFAANRYSHRVLKLLISNFGNEHKFTANGILASINSAEDSSLDILCKFAFNHDLEDSFIRIIENPTEDSVKNSKYLNGLNKFLEYSSEQTPKNASAGE